MKTLLQRVTNASVTIDGTVHGSIGLGFVLFVCVMDRDNDDDIEAIAEKVVGLRLWESEDGKVNDRAIIEMGGEILVISQFTLAGETTKGRRPDYTKAARPEYAEPIYNKFLHVLKQRGIGKVASGKFGEDMQVTLTNDGPVTLMLESR